MRLAGCHKLIAMNEGLAVTSAVRLALIIPILVIEVVIIDDLIATGGTTEAIIKLVEREGGEVVKIGFVMELEGLKGKERLKGYDVFSLISYPGN